MGTRGNRAAFTLVELMIVVGIIGILASIAIPAFIGYQKRVRRSEGSLMINAIYKGLVSYAAQEFLTNQNGGTTQMEGQAVSNCRPKGPATVSGTIPGPPFTTKAGEKHYADFSADEGARALGLTSQMTYGVYQLMGPGAKSVCGLKNDSQFYFTAAAFPLETAGTFEVAAVNIVAQDGQLVRPPGLSWVVATPP